MASIRFSAVGGEIKGKINGTVFQGGKSGPIVKRLIQRSFVRVLALLYGMPGTVVSWIGSTAQLNPDSKCILFPDGSHNAQPLDTNQRVLLSKISALWRFLTPEQRTAWNASAVNFPFKNRFGDVYTGSGFQVFMELNMNMAKLNQSVLYFPPANDQPLLPSILFPDPDVDAPLSVTFPDGIPVNQKVQVWSSVGQSNGRYTKMKNPKLIAVLDSFAPGMIVNLRYIWQVFFGVLNANTTIQLQFVPIDNTTGVKGQPLILSALIDAIASGAKLTKADSGRALDGVLSFSGTPINTTGIIYWSLGVWNIPEKVDVEITGPDAADFQVTLNNLDSIQPVHTLPTDQYGNHFPSPVDVTFAPTVIGAKTATLKYKNAAGVVVFTQNLVGLAIP